MEKTDNNLYIILHVPKTGGTTIKRHVELNFDKEETLFLYNELNPKFETKYGVEKYISSLGKEERDKIKIIIGHDVYYGIHKYFNKNPKYILFLREPLYRLISAYNSYITIIKNKKEWNRWSKLINKVIYKNGKILNFNSMIKLKNRQNNLCKFLLKEKSYIKMLMEKEDSKNINEKSVRKIKKILDNFYFVGLSENEEDFLFLYNKLDIKRFVKNQNISKKYVKIKNSTKKEVLKNNSWDYMIYDYCIKFNSEFKKNNQSFYMNVRKIKYKRKIYFFINYQISPMLYVVYKISEKLKEKIPIYRKFIYMTKNLHK